MEFNGWWLITIGTLDGPWHVASSYPSGWVIVNILTDKSKYIGPVRRKGTNYFDRAEAEAKRRNDLFLKEHAAELPKYMGRFECFDKTIAKVLRQAVE